MLTDDELRATLSAGARWARTRDIPDPVGWMDLVYAEGAMVDVAQSRIREEVAPARTHQLPLPKGLDGGFRELTIPDPFDEIVYRGLIGRVASVIDNSLGPEVESYRLISAGPGWTTRNQKYTHASRSERLQQMMDSTDFSGVATLDVQQYYPSVDIDRLEQLIVEVGGGLDASAAICSYLREWNFVGVRGIPTGPEASALLGNLYLLPVDEILRRNGVDFARFTDDYRILLVDSYSWQAIADDVAEAASSLGLTINDRKTRVYRSRHGVKVRFENPDIEEIKRLLRSEEHEGLATTLDLFDAEVNKPSPDPKRLKFFLGVLRVQKNRHALSIAQDWPEILRANPRAWGDYLSAIHAEAPIDQEWLFAVAVRPFSKETAAVSYHMYQVLTKRRLGRDHGRKLRELSTDNARDWVPIRCSAADAWSKSDDWKPLLAVDAAHNVGDCMQRRALALTLRGSSWGVRVDRALTQLRRTVPEVRPTIAWLDSTSTAA